jgi:hypothetical protein
VFGLCVAGAKQAFERKARDQPATADAENARDFAGGDRLIRLIATHTELEGQIFHGDNVIGGSSSSSDAPL